MRIDYEHTYKVELMQHGIVFRVWDAIGEHDRGKDITAKIKDFVSILKTELVESTPKFGSAHTEGSLRDLVQHIIKKSKTITAIEAIGVTTAFAFDTFPLVNVSGRGIVVYKDFPQLPSLA